ncbi:MAG: ABC transporter permease [Firmicutes bacterium]|jgi:ABC-2 type transport system permease protein|nr:ABC transporter permease [Bacillota bacterium]MDH7496375.1 ABC transporter permease [Bacillota bacterium]
MEVPTNGAAETPARAKGEAPLDLSSSVNGRGSVRTYGARASDNAEAAYRVRQAIWAIAAIFRRDWLIYWRYPMNAVFWLMQPFIWFTPVYFMGLSFVEDGKAAGFEAFTGTSDFMAFVILGGIMSSYVSAVFWSIGTTLKNEMTAGVLESNWLAPVPRAVQLVGRTAFSLVSVTCESCFLMVVMRFMFRFDLGRDIIPAVLTAIPMVVGIYGFGFAFAGLVLLMRDAYTMIDISSYLVNLLSGSTVPVVAFPRFLLVIAMAIPLTYGYDAVRGILLGTRTLLPIRVEQAILIGFMGVMVVLGLWAFGLVERRCRRLGTLTMH